MKEKKRIEVIREKGNLVTFGLSALETIHLGDAVERDQGRRGPMKLRRDQA